MAAKKRQKKLAGRVLWEGPSLIDGKPVVVVAVPSTDNTKTGMAIQIYVLRSDIPPNEAVEASEDKSICGSCIHRANGDHTNNSCYVIKWRGPSAVFRNYKAGRYAKGTPEQIAAMGWMIRGTAYGDGAVVPYDEVWEPMLDGNHSPDFTGFTHQMEMADPRMKRHFMASVETMEQARRWQAEGWKTYRTRLPNQTMAENEVPCPASKEMGHRLLCNQCLRCNGEKHNVSIVIHGAEYLQKRFVLKMEIN